MARAKRKRISPIQLEDAVAQILDEYGAECTEILDRSIGEVTVSAVLDLQSVRRFAPNGKISNQYAPSWTFENTKSGRFRTVSTIYNADHYRLTHLLEFGHIGKNGTRKDGSWSVSAYPHIAPVNEKVQAELIEEFRRRMEGI